MGQAKQRGTFEDRQKQAIEKQNAIKEALEKQAAEKQKALAEARGRKAEKEYQYRQNVTQYRKMHRPNRAVVAAMAMSLVLGYSVKTNL